MKCLRCNAENCKEVTRTKFMVTRGLELEVDGITNWLCTDCGSEFETADQADRNTDLVKNAFIAARSSEKERLGLLSGAEIKAIREKYRLTQADAAKVFGGGLRAFSKYENEEIVQAESMDRLLRCAREFGEVVAWLAQRHNVTISQHCLNAQSHTNFVFQNEAALHKTGISVLAEPFMTLIDLTDERLSHPGVRLVKGSPTSPSIEISPDIDQHFYSTNPVRATRGRRPPSHASSTSKFEFALNNT